MKVYGMLAGQSMRRQNGPELMFSLGTESATFSATVTYFFSATNLILLIVSSLDSI